MDASALIHAAALCESRTIGDGTRVWAFAHVMEDVHIGSDCNVCDHVFIESGAFIGDRVTIKNGATIFEGVHIEDDAFIGPGVIFTNDRYPRRAAKGDANGRYENKSHWLMHTRVGRGASIGAGAVICPGVTLGPFSMVAAGAVVTRDTHPHSLVVGVPARERGWMCRCGFALAKQGDSQLVCTECGDEYIFRAGMVHPGA